MQKSDFGSLKSLFVVSVVSFLSSVASFQLSSYPKSTHDHHILKRSVTKLCSSSNNYADSFDRNTAIKAIFAGFSALSLNSVLSPIPAAVAEDMKYEVMPALQGKDYGKPRTKYPDFKQLPSGLQYRDVKEGEGQSPEKGDRVVAAWEGYTIGYYGRPFEAGYKVKGGAFDKGKDEKDLLRFVVGSGKMIAGLEEGVQGMREGGIRQLVVPVELGYPPSDPKHEFVGPKPSTFSGMRALNFVLENEGLIDKTVLINVEIKRVDKPGQRGFKG